MAEPTKMFLLSLPEDMKAQLRNEAENNGRSLTKEIIHRLKKTLDNGSDNKKKRT